MVHEEQGIVGSPLWSTDTSGGDSAVGTVASHVTTEICQLQMQGGEAKG